MYWDHPGGNQCVAIKNKPSEGRLMEVRAYTLRCQACRKNHEFNEFEFKCDYHSDFKKGKFYDDMVVFQ